MQNAQGNKYVPPPQRYVVEETASYAPQGLPQYDMAPPPVQDYSYSSGRWDESQGDFRQAPRGGYQSRQGGFGGYSRGPSYGSGYDSGYQGGYSGGAPYYDNRGGFGAPSGFSSFGGRGFSNGGGGRGGGYGGRSHEGGYGGGSGYSRGGGSYSIGSRVNSLGFHGDERPDSRLEDKLFRKGDGQTAGINFDKYDDIPVEVSDGCPPPITEFTEETMGPQLFRNMTLCNFNRPTPVQKYSIPIGLLGADMMACAQTGSGKTGGFLFPVIVMLMKNGPLPLPEGRRDRSSFPSALVLAPTRELASQIHEEALKFTYCTGLRPVVIYGGAPVNDQQRDLDRGADILIATPGRLVDFIERGRVKQDIIQFLVLDEADRMLDMGFEPQIRRIVQEEGMPLKRQTFMFSATFPVEIQRLAGDFLTDYIFVSVGSVGAPSRDVIQRVEWVEQQDKINRVLDFLSNINEGLILIFVETKRGADQLEEILYNTNIPASSIHGDKSQREREEALRSFKTGKTPVLVATDVAARGLDIPNVTNVINYDLPSNLDDYIHRIGRTGRVGNVGYALSFFNEKNSNIGKELAESLINNDQECPEWLERRYFQSGASTGGRGGRGRGRGGRFGARDYRKDTGRGRGSDSSSRGPSSASSVRTTVSSSTASSSAAPPLPYHATAPRNGMKDNSAW